MHKDDKTCPDCKNMNQVNNTDSCSKSCTDLILSHTRMKHFVIKVYKLLLHL